LPVVVCGSGALFDPPLARVAVIVDGASETVKRFAVICDRQLVRDCPDPVLAPREYGVPSGKRRRREAIMHGGAVKVCPNRRDETGMTSQDGGRDRT
jgi:hypothetical protein